MSTLDKFHKNLDFLKSATDASLREIWLNIDFPEGNTKEILQFVYSKLRYGGTLNICGSELDEICRSFFTRNLKEEEVEEKLYRGRRRCFTYKFYEEFFNTLGLKTITRRVNDHEFYLKMIRPKPE